MDMETGMSVANSVIIIDKPRGMTSQGAVSRVKATLGAAKAGHAGTLDPIATGVLLVCVGEATKVSRFLMDMKKEYVVTMKFGQRTDTFDAEGRVVESSADFDFSLQDARAALRRFTGEILQCPPMYSALKHQGTPLYKLARRGLEVERPERKVRVYGIDIMGFELPFMTLSVSCSKGTYIRTLVDDLGRALGTFAHVTDLRRSAVGPFRAERAVSPFELGTEAMAALCDVDEAVAHLEPVVLDERDYVAALHGVAPEADRYGSFDEGFPLRLKGPEGNLFALARATGGRLKIERILHLEGKKNGKA